MLNLSNSFFYLNIFATNNIIDIIQYKIIHSVQCFYNIHIIHTYMYIIIFIIEINL